MENRVCSKCGEAKPLNQFEKDNRVPSGRGTRCRVCVREYARQWRNTNRDAYNAYFKSYYQQHKDEHAEDTSRWYRANKSKVRAAGRRRYAVNPDPLKEKRQRQYWAKPDRERANARRWRKANPIAHRAHEAHRRALKLHSNGKYTPADVQRLLETQAGLCHWCQSLLDVYHVDHVVPLSRGGSNSAENIALACPSCNLRKKDKTPEEWQALLIRLKIR